MVSNIQLRKSLEEPLTPQDSQLPRHWTTTHFCILDSKFSLTATTNQPHPRGQQGVHLQHNLMSPLRQKYSSPADGKFLSDSYQTGPFAVAGRGKTYSPHAARTRPPGKTRPEGTCKQKQERNASIPFYSPSSAETSGSPLERPVHKTRVIRVSALCTREPQDPTAIRCCLRHSAQPQPKCSKITAFQRGRNPGRLHQG